jgi:diacylglycerol kinase (ATP)
VEYGTQTIKHVKKQASFILRFTLRCPKTTEGRVRLRTIFGVFYMFLVRKRTTQLVFLKKVSTTLEVGEGCHILMNKNQSKPNKNPLGFKRIVEAFGYSFEGLKHATKKEPAFQQELMLLVLMTLIAIIAPFSVVVKVALIISHLLILIVELLNSAIEAVVNKASPEYHPLAKQAKDMGSASVLLGFLISSIIWVYAVYSAIV